MKCKDCGNDGPYCGEEDGLPHPTYKYNHRTMEWETEGEYANSDHKDICCDCVDEGFGMPSELRSNLRRGASEELIQKHKEYWDWIAEKKTRKSKK